jgi:hypothetical protein
MALAGDILGKDKDGKYGWITDKLEAETMDWATTEAKVITEDIEYPTPGAIVRTTSTTEYEIEWDKVTCFDHIKDILKAIKINIHYTDGEFVNSDIEHLIKEKK